MISGSLFYLFRKNQKLRELSKHIEIENENQKSEEKIRKLSIAVEQSPVTIVITDKEGRIEYVNPKFVDLTGYSPEEVIGKNPRILKSGKTPLRVYEELWRKISNGEQWRGEFINKKKNGEMFWESASISPLVNNSGKITSFVAVKEDITAKKKAEEEILKSKEQLASVIDTALDGIIIIDENLNIVLFNPAAEQMFQITAGEALGQPVNKLIPHRFQNTHDDNVHKFIDENSEPRLMGKDGFITGVRSTGEEFYIEASMSQFESGGHKYYTVIHREISKRIQLQDELKRSEERLRGFFDSGLIGIVYWHLDERIIEANDRFLEMSGFTRQELEEGQINLRDMTPLEFQNLDEVSIKELKETDKNAKPFEKEYIRKDGSRFPVLIARTLLYQDPVIGVSFVLDLTDQKTAEKELKASEEKFQKIFLNSPVAKALADADDYTTIDVNHAFEMLYGYQRNEIIGKTSEDIHLYEDLSKRTETIELLKTGAPIRDLEINIIRKDGQKRIVLLDVEHIEIKGKRCLLAVSRDITDRKMAEEYYRMLLNSIDEGFSIIEVIFDEDNKPVDYKFLEINPAFEKQTGLKNAQGKRVRDLLPLTEQYWFETYGNIALTGVPNRFQSRAEQLNRWYDVYAFKVGRAEERHVAVLFNDITKQKQSEEALLASEERFSKAFIANPNALVISLTEDGTIIDVNETFLKLFGYTREEVIGTSSISQKMFAYIEDRQRAINLLRTAGHLRDFEVKIITKSGKERIVLLSAELLQVGGGNSLLTVLQDITERKSQEKQLDEAIQDLKRSNKDLEQFAYTASHDLQEPIRMIKSYAKLIEMKNKFYPDDESKQYLGFISEGALRMQNLVDDLLKYSRVSTVIREFEPVDCTRVLKEVLDDLRFKIEEENAIIQISELPVIKGDKTLIRLLFQNFIQNSLKFRSEKAPEIIIDCERRNNAWLFSILDNGIGIDSKFYEKIFVLFQRLHDREQYPGTGIGLSLCKKIIERHGGQVCVESIIDKGTIFYFTMPAE